jgi:hypothetical protein
VTTLFLADTSAYTIARKMPAAKTRLRQLTADAVLATSAGVMDLLTAAAAEHYGASVLHDVFLGQPASMDRPGMPRQTH